MRSNPEQWIFGRPTPPVAPIELRAGPLEMLFHEDSGFLRRIRVGTTEVLRGIYVSVRDGNWKTLPPLLTEISLEVGESSFRARYQARCRDGDIDFTWLGVVSGSESGEIQYSMEGEARSGFWKNRLGFCVLHPIRECAGRDCTLEHVDGTVETSSFPTLISPHQPFRDLRAISYEPFRGLAVKAEFAGDTFETEDQRNWGDASYKTYCTPQSIPFPAFVEKGTRVEQSVRLRLSEKATSAERPKPRQAARMTRGEAVSVPLPGIGLTISRIGLPGPAGVRALKRLSLSHLRNDVFLHGPGWEETLALAMTEASTLGVGLEMVLHVTDSAEKELKNFREFIANEPPAVVRCVVLHQDEESTSARWVELARSILSDYLCCSFGTGTNAHFTELNRHHPAVSESDFLCFPAHPQVHLSDDMTIVENLSAQADVVRSARRFAGRVPIVVTPVTLGPRPVGGSLVPEEADPRQGSLLGAAWTVGSVKYLSESRADSGTWFETVGPAGLLRSGLGEASERVHPLYFVFAATGAFAGGRLLPIESSSPDEAVGMILCRDNRSLLLLANLTPAEILCEIDAEAMGSLLGGVLRIKALDRNSVQEAVSRPRSFLESPGDVLPISSRGLRVSLSSYAVTWIEGSSTGFDPA